MMGYYIVDEVVERAGSVTAELIPVTWFKTNPDFTAWKALYEDDESEMPEEFIDAQPGEVDADYISEGPKIKLDITQGPEMHPADNVLLEYRVLATVDA